VNPPIDAHRSAANLRGFTLLEVVMAMALLAGVLLAIGQVLIVAASTGEASRRTTMAVGMAAQKLEQLRALALGVDASGADVDDHDTDLGDWPAAFSGGAGLSYSPPGTLAANTAGYADYLDARGRWVGSGESPPATAAFARRWSIAPDLSSTGATTLVLRVAVLRRGPPGTGAAVWVPVVQFDAARTRRPS
jgi:prepilin-type N-terminal cleavage/methylation domain-containing protein